MHSDGSGIGTTKQVDRSEEIFLPAVAVIARRDADISDVDECWREVGQAESSSGTARHGGPKEEEDEEVKQKELGKERLGEKNSVEGESPERRRFCKGLFEAEKGTDQTEDGGHSLGVITMYSVNGSDLAPPPLPKHGSRGRVWLETRKAEPTGGGAHTGALCSKQVQHGDGAIVGMPAVAEAAWRSCQMLSEVPHSDEIAIDPRELRPREVEASRPSEHASHTNALRVGGGCGRPGGDTAHKAWIELGMAYSM